MARGYGVRRTIDAGAERVWNLLTDGDGYPDWNPTVISLEGPIADGGQIRLVSAASPKRTFALAVTTPQLLRAVRRRSEAGGRGGGGLSGPRVRLASRHRSPMWAPSTQHVP